VGILKSLACFGATQSGWYNSIGMSLLTAPASEIQRNFRVKWQIYFRTAIPEIYEFYVLNKIKFSVAAWRRKFVQKQWGKLGGRWKGLKILIILFINFSIFISSEFWVSGGWSVRFVCWENGWTSSLEEGSSLRLHQLQESLKFHLRPSFSTSSISIHH
jgi:hypothetical protein